MSVMRREDGFTLVELGVILAVVAVLATAVVTGGRGFSRVARSQRTAKEMTALLDATVHAVNRDAVSTTGCTAGSACTSGAPNNLRYLGVDLNASASGVCMDLAGSGWGGAGAPVPNLAMSVGSPTGSVAGIPNGGRNAYGLPIAVCAWRRLVRVATCVPTVDIPREIGGGSPDGCPGAPWNFTCGAGFSCIGASVTLLPPNSARTAMTYRYLYWGEATTAP